MRDLISHIDASIVHGELNSKWLFQMLRTSSCFLATLRAEVDSVCSNIQSRAYVWPGYRTPRIQMESYLGASPIPAKAEARVSCAVEDVEEACGSGFKRPGDTVCGMLPKSISSGDVVSPRGPR